MCYEIRKIYGNMIQTPKALRELLLTACAERVTGTMSADWILGHIYNQHNNICHANKTKDGQSIIVKMGLSKQAVMNDTFHVDVFLTAKLIKSLNFYMKKRFASQLNIITDFELTAIPDAQNPDLIRIDCECDVERDGIVLKSKKKYKKNKE